MERAMVKQPFDLHQERARIGAGPDAGSLPARGNRLLRALPAEELERLARHLHPAELASQEVIYAENAEIRHVYFPVSGVVSLLYITADGEPTEVALVGNEGVIGVGAILGADSTTRRALVQIPGDAYRIRAGVLRDEFRRGSVLQVLMLRYVQSLTNQMAQTAVCNRHHTVEQQLCRWLLLTLDRISTNEVFMTHEMVSHMLGVRRAGISDAAKKLQRLGLIGYRRGHIVVPDRRKLEEHACECYGVVKRETDRLLPPG
jgi:CRP-like cAMP-binding protein